MLPKLGKGFLKAAWGKGGKESTGRFHLVSSFRTKTFAWVTVPRFQSPLTTSGTPNPVSVSRMGKDGISGGTEEQDAVLSAQDELTAGSAHPDSAGEGRKAFEAARFRGRESSGTSGSGARPPFPGAQLATAGHSSPRSARSPGRSRSAAERSAGARGRASSRIATMPGCSQKSRALIKLMACLACNLSSWVSTSLWSNRFT